MKQKRENGFEFEFGLQEEGGIQAWKMHQQHKQKTTTTASATMQQ